MKKLKKNLERNLQNYRSERLKKTVIEITFSYWDGSNHRRTMRIERGTSIVDFLEMARKELEKNFISLRGSLLKFIKDKNS